MRVKPRALRGAALRRSEKQVACMEGSSKVGAGATGWRWPERLEYSKGMLREDVFHAAILRAA